MEKKNNKEKWKRKIIRRNGEGKTERGNKHFSSIESDRF